MDEMNEGEQQLIEEELAVAACRQHFNRFAEATALREGESSMARPQTEQQTGTMSTTSNITLQDRSQYLEGQTGMLAIQVQNLTLESVGIKSLGSRGSSNEAPMVQAPGSKFLQLPGELRNRILSLAVVGHRHVNISIICYRKDESKAYWRISDNRPGLAKVCKSIREEALSIFYSENAFFLTQNYSTDTEIKRLELWTAYLGQYAEHLSDLIISTWIRKLDGTTGDHFDAPYTVRAKLMPGGAVTIGTTCNSDQVTLGVPHCSCEFYQIASTPRPGHLLLELAREAASNVMALAETQGCLRCQLPRIHIVQRAD